MPHNTPLIAMLCVGFVAAFALGLVAQRLRLSPLAGYLLAGIVAGPYTPGFVADQTLAPQLAEVGVILLMFGVGLHFSLNDLMQVRRVAVPGALARIGAITALGWAMGWLFRWPHATGLFFGLSLSVASTVVVLRVLEEHQLLDSRLGRVAIGWVIVEDLTMVAALVLLPALASATGGHGSLTGQLAWTFAKISAFIIFMLVVGRRVIPRVLQQVAGLASRELFTLCVLAIAMGVAYGAAKLFGVSFALGAFFAGMLMSESEFSHKAANDSLPLRDAFAVLFFVSVGMLFDPGILLRQPLQVLLTFLIIVGGKSLIGWLLLRLLREPPRSAALAATGLAQIGEFSFILAGLGLSLQLIPQAVSDLILAGALMSIIVNPSLFAWVQRSMRRRDVNMYSDEAGTLDRSVLNHVILIGYGRVGRELSRLLRERGVPLVLIETDPDRVEAARHQGLTVVRGNAVAPRVLAEARPQDAQLAILAVPQALEAGEIIVRLKQAAPDLTVLTRAHSQGEVEHLLKQGADAAVLAERELAIHWRTW